MLAETDDRCDCQQRVAIMARWWTSLFAVCFSGTAIAIASLILARANSFLVRTSVLLIPFLFLILCLDERHGFLIRLARPLRLMDPRVSIAGGLAAGFGVVLILLTGGWPGLVVLMLVLAFAGAALSSFVIQEQRSWLKQTIEENIARNNRETSLLSMFFLGTSDPRKGAVVEFLRKNRCHRERSQLVGVFKSARWLFPIVSEPPSRKLGSRGYGRNRTMRRPDLYIVQFRNRVQHRIVSGEARACFSPQQQVCSVHIPFWPPYEAVPQVRVWSRGRTRVKVGKVYPFGMRLDVRLSSAAQRDMQIPIRFRVVGREKENASIVDRFGPN